MDVLKSDNSDKQIFSMKDGKFILEIEDVDSMDVTYFWSNNLNDLKCSD